MTDLLVTCTHDAASGFTDESFVNTFAIKVGVPVTDAVCVDIANAIADFYNGANPTGGTPLRSYISPSISRASGSSRLRFYDITGATLATVPAGAPAGTKPRPPAHGSPFREDSFTLGASGSADGLPHQVAVVLTLRGRDAIAQPAEGPGGIRPRGRRSGRMFFGPLALHAREGGDRASVAGGIRIGLPEAAERLQDNLVDGDYAWSVWSRTTGQLHPIERVECDDSFDVLRSRKLNPSVRTVRTFNPEPALVLGA